MPDAYTRINKPTGTPYTKIAKASTDVAQYGFAIYGTSTYGANPAYTSVAKPTGATYTKVAKPIT